MAAPASRLAVAFALLASAALLAGCEPGSQEVAEPAAARSVAALPGPSALATLRRGAIATGGDACPAVTAPLGPHRGGVYYAAPTGHGRGLLVTSPAPLAEILAQLVPGDKVVALPGDYGEVAWPAGISGNAEAPITLSAQHPAVAIEGTPPELVARPAAAQNRTALSLVLHDIEHVRIEGIYGRIEIEGGGHIELAGNHHYEQPGQNLQLFDVAAVSVHHSLFENYRLKPGSGADWHTDYGIAAYVQAGLAVHHNLFSGGFNHAISLKERNHEVSITCNRFTNCGRHCLELGQQTDGRPPGQPPVDRTSSGVLVENNLIEKTDDKLVNADFAVMVMNVDDVALSRNRFIGFEHSLLISSYWAPSYCSDLGEAMSQIGLAPRFVRLADNEFIGATGLRITGRGVAGDRVEIGGSKGATVSCGLRPLTPLTCDAACCRWDPPPATEAAPEVTLLDDTVSCAPEAW